MPYVTDARLLIRHPEAVAVDPVLREIKLGDAAAEIEEELWEGMTEHAHALLTMHYLQLQPNSGLPGAPSSGGAAVSGPITSRKAGEISASYGGGKAEALAGPHSQTGYGQQFDALADKIPSIPVAV